MLLPPPDIGAAYVDEDKRPSKDFYNWVRSLYEFTRGIGIRTVTVAGLPAAVDNKGVRYLVSDANAVTFWTIVAAGGANIVPVTSDGLNWRIG
jgi:hypothetical protein